MGYLEHIVFLLGMNLVLALALNIAVGQTGILLVSQGMLAGVGAYATAIGTTKLAMPAGVCVLCGGALGGLLGWGIGSLRGRLSQDVHAVSTLAMQLLFTTCLAAADPITGGMTGILGIRPITIPVVGIDGAPASILAIGALLAATAAVTAGVARSNVGLVLRGVRDDAMLVESLGPDVNRCREVVCAFVGCVSSVAGSVHAHYAQAVEPSQSGVAASIGMLTIVLVAGTRSLWDTVWAATVYTALPEVLRLLGVSSVLAASVRDILFGSGLILLVISRVAGARAFRKAL